MEISKALEIEYNALKAEQRQRISTRDNILYLQIAVLAGLVSIFDKLSSFSFLAIVPFVSLVLGWKYISNDIKITQIGLYFRKKNKEQEIFNFESDIRIDPKRKIRKWYEMSIKFLLFLSPIFISCTSLFLNHYNSILISSMGLIYLTMGLFLAYFFVTSGDVK